MAQRRKSPKATHVSVHVGIGGTALVLQFITLKEGDFTVAVPVHAARTLANMLLVKANEAEILTNQGGAGLRH